MLLFIKVFLLFLTSKMLLEAEKKRERTLLNDLKLKLRKKVTVDYYESTCFSLFSFLHSSLSSIFTCNVCSLGDLIESIIASTICHVQDPSIF